MKDNLKPVCSKLVAITFATFLLAIPVVADDLLVEAESFELRGGWQLDTQFIREMGSPYLLAHGLGKRNK